MKGNCRRNGEKRRRIAFCFALSPAFPFRTFPSPTHFTATEQRGKQTTPYNQGTTLGGNAVGAKRDELKDKSTIN